MDLRKGKPSSEQRDHIQSRIQQVPYWFHAFEIVPGIITPGEFRVDARAKLNKFFGLDQSLAGKRILEIGTWDGAYAFELELRQAEVVATDIQAPDATGFNTGKQILKSQVTYVQTSVYDLQQHVDGLFDIVLFMGVFYHLKYPLLAFEQIRRMLKIGGLLLFEGECFSHYAETSNNTKLWTKLALNSLLLTLVAHSEIPIALSYRGTYKSASNWFIPNVACLKNWLLATGFDIQRFQTSFPKANFQTHHKMKYFLNVVRCLWTLRGSTQQRAWGIASRIDIASELEHPLIKRKNAVNQPQHSTPESK